METVRDKVPKNHKKLSCKIWKIRDLNRPKNLRKGFHLQEERIKFVDEIIKMGNSSVREINFDPSYYSSNEVTEEQVLCIR